MSTTHSQGPGESSEQKKPGAVWSWREDLREVPQDEWEALLRRQTRPSPFLSPSFLLPWCASFAPEGSQKIGMWHVQGQLSGLICLQRRTSGSPEGSGGSMGWELCGGQDLADRLDALIVPGAENLFWSELFPQMSDPITFPNLGEDSSLLKWGQGPKFTITQTDSSPYLTLPDNFEAYLGFLAKKDRHEVRRKLRRAEGGVRFQAIHPPNSGELDTWLAHFIRLHRLSHSNKQEFMTESMEKFFCAMAMAFAQRGQLRLGFLLGDDEPIAGMLQLDFDNKFHLYNSGFNPEHRNLAPGVVLLAHCIRNAIALQRHEYEFLRGRERYKYDLGGQDRAVMKVEYQP